MNELWKNCTNEEIQLAKSASITEVARMCGYTPVRKTGKLMVLKEDDDITFYNDRTFVNYSVSSSSGRWQGGTAIDFLKYYGGIDNFIEAVQVLCEFQGYTRLEQDKQSIKERIKKVELAAKKREQNIEKKEFELPPKADNMKILYKYMKEKRNLDTDTISYFVEKKMIYESRENFYKKNKNGEYLTDEHGAKIKGTRYNIVFLGINKEGVPEFASKRGTLDDYGIVYKGNVAGSNLECGFNLTIPGATTVRVFEAAIDMMSFCEINNDFEKTSKIALATTSDGALRRYLKENENIKEICFCLDNDYAGVKSMCIHAAKYLGYNIEIDKIYELETPPKAWMPNKDTIVLSLHPDEEVNQNKELKESDKECLKNILDHIVKLKSKTKYTVNYMVAVNGKDFNDQLKYMKAKNIPTGIEVEREMRKKTNRR